MSIVRIYSVFCDSCPNWIAETNQGVVAARKEAKDAGWKRENGRDICPHCQKREVASV